VCQQQAPGFCTVPGCPTDIYAQTVRDTTTTSSTTYGYDALDRRRDRATTSNASTSTTTTYTDSTGTPLAPTLGLPPLPEATSTRGTTTSSTGTEYDGSTSNELQQYDDSATTTRPAIGPSTRATSSSTLTYTLGGDGAPLAEFGTTAATSTDPTAPPSANSSTDSAGWLSTDGHGTVATVSNYAGQTLCAARFDPYGTPERQKYTDNHKATTFTYTQSQAGTNTLPADPDPQNVCSSGTSTNQRWYRGTSRDASTGRYTLGSRSYDPATASFTTTDRYRTGTPSQDTALTADPLTADTYTYVNGDPVNLTDPDGHCTPRPDAICVDGNGTARDGDGTYLHPSTPAQRQYNDTQPQRQARAAASAVANRAAVAQELHNHALLVVAAFLAHDQRAPDSYILGQQWSLEEMQALNVAYTLGCPASMVPCRVGPIDEAHILRGESDGKIHGPVADALALAVEWAPTFIGGAGLARAGVRAVAGALGRGLGETAAAAAETAGSTDTIVLGHYPEYVDVAKASGGRTFEVPTKVWDSMSPEQQWTANQKFLDRAIARGSNVQLATPANAAREGSYYERELQYMQSKGYSVGPDGMSLLPPGGG